MTLDEAIKHCEEKAKELREQPFKEKMDIEDIATCEEYAEEHEQLAEWLKELKALKGNANEPKGDLISRSALKEAIFKRQYYIDGVDEVYNAIDNAPTVPQTIITEFKGCDNCELERPKGKWVFKDLHNGKTWYECSICGRKIHVGDKVQLSDFPFCHCGADMRGDAE